MSETIFANLQPGFSFFYNGEWGVVIDEGKVLLFSGLTRVTWRIRRGTVPPDAVPITEQMNVPDEIRLAMQAALSAAAFIKEE